MAGKLVKCLYCGKTFYKDKEEYEMVGKRYVHKQCYLSRLADQEYEEKIYEMMKSLLEDDYSKTKITRQIKNFREDGKTVEGMYEALVYFYDVKQNSTDKANGGIGIVPYVYTEAKNYFSRQRAIKKKHLGENISSYVENDTKVIIVKKKPVRKPMRTKLFKLE